MELYEYQAKELLRRFFVPMPPHYLIEGELPKNLDIDSAYVRPQVLGKGEEEKKATSKEEIKEFVHEFLQKSKKVLVIPCFTINKTYSFRIEVSDQGTVSAYLRDGEKEFIEEVFEGKKLFRFQIFRMMTFLKISIQLKESFVKIIEAVVNAFFAYDASCIEIDPFVITDEETILAASVHMHIDDSALFRQKEIMLSSEKASDKKFYPKGSIGCIATGSGILELMSSVLKKRGKYISESVDVGDVFSEEHVHKILESMSAAQGMNTICMNLFTGIADGAKVIENLLRKKDVLGAKKLFIRLEGTNVSGGIRVAGKQHNLYVFSTLEELIEKV